VAITETIKHQTQRTAQNRKESFVESSRGGCMTSFLKAWKQISNKYFSPGDWRGETQQGKGQINSNSEDF